MEEKKKFKISQLLIISALAILIFALSGMLLSDEYKGEHYKVDYYTMPKYYDSFDNIDITKLTKKDYIVINSYDKYITYRAIIEKLYSDYDNESNTNLNNILNKIDKTFFEQNSLIITNYLSDCAAYINSKIKSVRVINGFATINLFAEGKGCVASSGGVIYLIPIEGKVYSAKVNITNNSSLLTKNGILIISIVAISIILMIYIFKIIKPKDKKTSKVSPIAIILIITFVAFAILRLCVLVWEKLR